MTCALKKPIKYIGYFDFQDSAVKRNYVLSAANKMEYIAQALCEAGHEVRIISHSAVTEPNFRFFAGETVRKSPTLSVKCFGSFGGTSPVVQLLKKLWHSVALFFYLIFHTERDEPVIVYHSLGYYNIILWAKYFRRFRMILELEEIYQDVSQCSFLSRKWELATIKGADGYILSTGLLNDKINTSAKPSIVIYGTYRVDELLSDKFGDGKIHVVYAGTLDPRKGAVAAVAAAQYLPPNYHLHILGSGSASEVDRINKEITDVSARSKASVSYEGVLRGETYVRFIQSCHIGLCPQSPDARYNDTSFPSKILSYMSNGLQVVSIDIRAIRSSAIGPYMTYYQDQTPEQIARAIERVHLSDGSDIREIIRRLNREFVANVSGVL